MPLKALPRVNPGELLRRLAWFPIPIFLLAIAALAWLRIDAVWNPQYLLPVLNILFLTGISLLIAFLAAKSYLAEPSAMVLLLGCGTLLLGLASGVAGFSPAKFGPNWTVTLYNIGACLAAACHLISAIQGFTADDRKVRSAWPALAILYSVMIALILLLAVAVHQGYLPVFFVERQGATIWNRAALWTAAGMFVFSAVLLRSNRSPERSAFIDWYSLGLGLIATGLIGVSLQKRFGSPLNWCGRTAQYLGGVYLLLAVIAEIRQSGRWRIPLADALRETEERYGRLVELCPVAILVHAEGKYLFANPAAVKLFGAGSAEEMIGRDVLELIHPDDRESVGRRIRQRLSDVKITPLTELRILRLDGRPVEVEVTAARIEYHGKPAIQVVLRDITERKRAEEALRQANERLEVRVRERTADLTQANEALRESEELFRMMANAIPQMAAIARPDGFIYWYNQRWHDYTGTTPEQMAGWGWQSVHDPQVLPKVLEQWQSSLATGQPFDMEFPLRGADGRFRSFLTRILPLRNSAGQIVQWVGTNTDITERRQMEEALRESEAHYRILFTSMNEGFALCEIICDESESPCDYRILEVNPAYETCTGLKAADVIGKTARELFPGIEPSWIELFGKVALTGEPIRFENYNHNTARYYDLFSFCPAPGRFAVLLENITEQKRAEAERRESEEQYRRLFEMESDAIFLVDIATGRFLDANHAATHLYGYSHDEFLSLDKGDISAEPQKTRQAIANQESRVALRWHRKKDGSLFPVEIAGSYYEWQGRQIHVAAIRDITERTRAEEALRESEEKLRLFIEHAPVALAMFDRQMCYLSVSRRWISDYGLAGDDLHGRSHYEVFPEISEYWKSVHRRGLAGEVVRAEAERFDRADGSAQWLHWEVRPWRDAEGYVAGIVIFSEDITERTRAEEALRRSEDDLAGAQAIAHIGSWRVNLKERNGDWRGSAELCRMYGYPADAALTMQTGMDRIHPEDRQACLDAFQGALRGTGPFAWVHRIVVDGQVKWMQVRVEVRRDESGQAVEVIGTNQDITMQRELEEHLRQSQKMEAIGQLAGGIAHDFNNMLTGILGYANMLKLEAVPGSDTFEAADVIEKAAERAADLTQKLLGFARRGKFLAVPVNLNDLVHDVSGLLGRTVDRKIRMTQRLGADAPLVLGDPNQLQQVILNLAINARDAMADGGELTIETRIEDLDEAFCREQPELKPGRHAVIEVTDTGCGIAAELRDRIFEPFFTTKPVGEGTGMGLAMVYGIVRNHGGHIGVTSTEGRGSTFRVYLPCHVVPTPARGISRLDIRLSGGRGGILLVDDEPVMLKVAGKMLRTLGYEVFEASNGQKAVAICAERAGQINLAVIDLVMPEMDGGETWRALRQIKPDLKAILSSGYGIDGYAQEIVDEGMQGFIQKPYKLNEFAEVVAQALKSSD